MRIIVIGGVAGGMSFATRYRRLNQVDEIIIFEKGPYVSFANCGLPYYLSGEINSLDKLIVAKDTMLINRFNIIIKQNHEVTKIDSINNRVIVNNDGNEVTYEYDKLIVSTGANPIIPIIKGSSLQKGFSLRNIPDLEKIKKYIDDNNVLNITLIGGGFIGLELAENLIKAGINVSIVEKSNQVVNVLDIEMAKFIENELKSNGVNVYLDNEVIEIFENRVLLKNNQMIESNMIIYSIGVTPNTNILNDSDVKLGFRKGIIVDHKFKTSNDSIYAIGDAIIVKQRQTNKDTLIPLASPANRQGRQLADILNGLDVDYKGTLGTSIVRVFNLTAAQTGLNEKQLENVDYQVIHLLANDHAAYYPDATSINLKVIYDKNTHKILGAQAVGKKGVDKRIDILSTAIHSNMLITELQELEFSYAPPFGSAKDIVNLAGYVAQNIILGLSKTIQWHEVDELISNGAYLIDVRSENEYKLGHIKNSHHIPIDQLRQRIDEIPRNKKIILYCQSGTRSYNAERILRPLGFECYNMDGSFSIYKNVGENINV